MDEPVVKPLIWVGSSYKDLLTVPDEVRRDFGYAFYLAQLGDKHKDAKPLAGFRGAGVLEVVENHDTDTYRAVYTVRLEGMIYVLHVFQKKSRQGIQTPRPDMNLIETRLKQAEEMHRKRMAEREQQ